MWLTNAFKIHILFSKVLGISHVILVLFPLIEVIIIGVVLPLVGLLRLPLPLLDTQLYELLCIIYIKPEIGHIAPGSVELKNWERIVAAIVFIITRYNSLISSALTGLVLCGGLALLEINMELDKIIQGNSVKEYKVLNFIMEKYLGTIQTLLKPMNTFYMANAYCEIAVSIMEFGAYGTVQWVTAIMRTIRVVAILLTHGAATSLVH